MILGKSLDDGGFCPVEDHRLCCQITDLVCFTSPLGLVTKSMGKFEECMDGSVCGEMNANTCL